MVCSYVVVVSRCVISCCVFVGSSCVVSSWLVVVSSCVVVVSKCVQYFWSGFCAEVVVSRRGQ